MTCYNLDIGCATINVTSEDIRVKVSGNDLSNGYLAEKIVAGTNVTVTPLNDGGVETLEISASGGGGGTDEKVKVSANDTTAGYLEDKIIGTASNISITTLNDGADEDSKVDLINTAVTPGSYTSADITVDNKGRITAASSGVSGSDEQVKVSANDTTPGYLEDKIVGVTNKIVVTTLNDGADEDTQINIGSDIFDKSSDNSDNITEGATNLFLTSAEQTDIANNTAKRHDPATVTDSANIDLTIVGQDITADLINTTVTPGSYTSTNLTVDANGRITAASNGAGGGGTSPSLRNVSATDTFSAASETINCTANTFTVNLPTAVGIQGTVFTLVNSGTGTITLDANGTETINGSLTIDIKKQYVSRTVQSDNANWIII